MTTLDVPAAGPTPGGWDRPAPAQAADVELLGIARDVAYEQPPGLVRRGDGQVLQLTPLLYSVLATLDGERSHEEVAADVAAATGRPVSAEDVAWLVEKRLEPLGVLEGRGPAVPPRANPLLGLRLRWVVSDEDVTRAVTRPFALLFHPVAVALVLASFVTSVGWLMANSGLAQAARQAVYEPLWLLVLLGLTLLSAAFHEFGHAAAARSVGATPGAMGVGLYLLWPAFYTDVTDAYRLGRRDRLRVDLGGLYFNAVFAVAGMLAWAATGVDALLLVLPVQLLQMARQLLPFLRYDGYHVLADLTGVPDLFSQMGPTLAALRPRNWGKPSASRLRRPARLLVLGWTLVTVPLLLAALGALLAVAPRLLATTADALAMHASDLRAATGRGDLATAALDAVRILTLTVAPLSIAYLVSRLGRQALRLAWRRTDGRTGARVGLLTLLAGLLALVAWAFAPDDDWEPLGAPDTGSDAAAAVAAAPTTRALPARSTLTAAPAAPQVGVAQARPTDGLPAPSPAGTEGSSAPVLPVGEPGGRAPAPDQPRAVPGDDRPAAGGDQPDGAGDGTTATPVEDEDEAGRTWVTELPTTWSWSVANPGAPRPQDNFAVAAVDGDRTQMQAFSTELLVGGSDVADQRNEAYALASCVDCGAVAAAFQVVLLPDTPNVVVPRNIAVALNENCDTCDTTAVANQLVVSLRATPDDATLAELQAVVDGLAPLADGLHERSAFEVRAAFEDAQRRILRILVEADPTSNTTPDFQSETATVEDDVVERSTSGDLDGATDPAAVTTDDTTATTDDAPSPTDVASPTPSPTPSTTAEPTTAPEEAEPSPTPSPEPSPLPSPAATEPSTTSTEEPVDGDDAATAPPPEDDPTTPVETDGTVTTTAAATEDDLTP